MSSSLSFKPNGLQRPSEGEGSVNKAPWRCICTQASWHQGWADGSSVSGDVDRGFVVLYQREGKLPAHELRYNNQGTHSLSYCLRFKF